MQVVLVACGSSPGGRNDGTGTDTDGTSSMSGEADTIGTSPDESSEDTSGGVEETGDDTPAEPPWRSGTRMRARVLDGGGGAIRQSGWHDTELGIDCNIVQVAEAGARCVPGLIHGLSTFADPECTQPVLIESCDVPEYIVVAAVDPAACPGADGANVYRVGAEVFDIYQETNDGCMAQALVPDNTHALEPVDPTMFAAFEPETVDRGDGLATTVWHGEDGSYEWRGVHDTVRDAACRPWEPAPDACVLSDRGFIWGDHHLDSLCMDQGVASSTYGPACGPPPLIEDGAMLYAVGAAVDPSAVYHDGEGCEVGPGDWVLDWGLFEIGAALAPSDFPSVVHASQGNERLQVTMLESPSGEAVAPHGGFWDSMFELECYETETTAGLRCLPFYWADVQFWSDATCTTTQLHHTYVDAVEPDVLPVYGGEDIFCTEPVSGVRVGALWDQPVFFFDGKACMPYEVYETDVFKVVEEQLALSDFAAIELIVE